MKKIISWAIVNGGAVYFLYRGYYLGEQPFQNVVSFGIWGLAILSLFLGVATFNEDCRKSIENDNDMQSPSVPREIELAFDLSFLFCLIYIGQFVLGILYVVHMIFQRLFFFNMQEHNKAISTNGKVDQND